MTKTIKLQHVSADITIVIAPEGEHHWYADDSRETELQWIGSEKDAMDLVARMVNRGGFERVSAS